MKRDTHNIDAANIPLGRLATKVAMLLLGKNKPGYTPNIDAGDFVVVKNFGEIKLTGLKIDQKEYFRYTGYLGGQKTTPIKRLLKEDPAKVLRSAVYRMLPKNKLRDRMIKRLIVQI